MQFQEIGSFLIDEFCILCVALGVPIDNCFTLFKDAPPPSYEAIFGKVKQIQKDSMEKVGSCGDKTYQTCVSIGEM